MTRRGRSVATKSSGGDSKFGEFSDRIKIVVLSGPDSGRKIVLPRGTHVIGKEPGCAVELTDPAVSRAHLEISWTPGGLQLRDLGSKNGTFYNHARLSQAIVGPGATVHIGATDLRFLAEQDPEPIAASTAEQFGRLVGGSLVMRELYALLERVAGADSTVLLTGETGTGKELCAEAIHQHSARAAGPFVICDLAAISAGLIESELFGHVRGAFTGADRDRTGAFVQAHGGTLFIDEVGELDVGLQPRLLRALEGRAVKPVGSTQYRNVDVRVIVATHRDLRAQCKAGRFREDLFHRLSVLPIALPPLRARKQDLPSLVARFAAPRELELPATTLGLLEQYDWPGNVRELGNVIARALAVIGDARVLSPEILELADPPAAPASSGTSATLDFHASKELMIVRWERAFLRDLLARADGKISEAARRSGIDRPYLHRLLKKHGLK